MFGDLSLIKINAFYFWIETIYNVYITWIISIYTHDTRHFSLQNWILVMTMIFLLYRQKPEVQFNKADIFDDMNVQPNIGIKNI